MRSSNQAFETMMIDTVEAQASFLAHMAGETGTLSFLSKKVAQDAAGPAAAQATTAL